MNIKRKLKIPNYPTNERIEQMHIGSKDIISLIRQLNPNKVTVSERISSHMLLLCDESVVISFKIRFKNILLIAIYPDIRKLANVTLIFKKGDKQLIKNYRPISHLPICGKILEILLLTSLYLFYYTSPHY